MGKKEFLKYCADNGIPEAETLYSKINGNPNVFVATLHKIWPAAFTPLFETQAKGKSA